MTRRYEPAISQLTKALPRGRAGPAAGARSHPDDGLHSLVSLVLAMQANKLVITSGSNWSRIMEELCLVGAGKSRCAIVDTTPSRPGAWRRRAQV